jgi:hypothetical protein
MMKGREVPGKLCKKSLASPGGEVREQVRLPICQLPILLAGEQHTSLP